jgi:hypothetical protein
MSTDPWRDPDPGPGDHDVDLATLDSAHVEQHSGDPETELRILVSFEDEDARRPLRIPEWRGQRPHDDEHGQG